MASRNAKFFRKKAGQGVSKGNERGTGKGRAKMGER